MKSKPGRHAKLATQFCCISEGSGLEVCNLEKETGSGFTVKPMS